MARENFLLWFPFDGNSTGGGEKWANQWANLLGHHSALMGTEEDVFACGYGKNGQLGLGDTNNQLTPTAIPARTQLRSQPRIRRDVALLNPC